MSTATHSFAPQQSRMRLTLRGRRLLASLLLAPIGVLGGVMLTQMPSALAGSSLAGASAEQFELHTVMPGESLWQIAESIAGTRDVRDVVTEIQRLNLLDGSGVQAGQQIALPNY